MHHRVMYPRQRQATLRVEGSKGTRNSSDLQRRASRSRYADPGSFSGSLSSPVAHLTKWPKNVFFASDFIAGMAAAPSSTNARRRRPRRGACSTNARKADARDPRTTTAGPESATGRRIKKDIAACRSSGCNARAVPQSIQGRPRIEFEESRPVVDVASAEEGGTSLEEAASALLLLHSRFVGGVRQEEGIVCRLCMLCKEAGWMGNPLRASPDLDPLVLEKMVVARLRSTGRQRNSASGHRKNNLSHSSASEEEELSFETFYRILADIATLVYPCEGKAMQRLLLEGVLPLAADKGPRTWSPSPELLYGRPALAALGMQRDALNELYCTYESRSTARAEKNSGDVITTGISRITFLNMLSDLGVTPASVSELHATSVFDNASRNGLAFSSRKPQGYRLCWSSFLEAMAALAVGAVKEWHTTANIEGHDREPVHKSGNSSKAGLDCNRDNSGRPGENAREARPRSRVRSPGLVEGEGEGRYPERRAPFRKGCEFGCTFEERAGEKEEEKVVTKGAQGVPSTGGRAVSFSERHHQESCGGGLYHDSRREVELMPTLRETEMDAPCWKHPGSPMRAQLPSYLLQKPQEGEGNMIVDSESTFTSTSTFLAANHPSPTRNTVTRREESGNASKARHPSDTTSPILQRNDETAGGALGCPWQEHRPTVKRATHASSRAKLNDDVVCAMVAPCSQTLPRPSVSSPGAAMQRVDDYVRCVQELHHGLSKQGETAETEASGGAETATAHSPVSLSMKEDLIDKRESGGLSPAPCHGGSLFAVQGPSSTISTASDGLKQPSTSCRGSLYEGKQQTQPLRLRLSLRGLESHTIDDCDDQGVSFHPRSCQPNPTRLITGSSSGGGGGQSSRTVGPASPKVNSVQEQRSTLPRQRRTDRKKVDVAQEESSSLRPGWGRHGRERKEVLHDNEDVPQREHCSEREKEGPDHVTTTDNVVVNFEAASATIFDELLEPMVIAVYSRHRKDLQKLFQRYSSFGEGPNGERLQYIGDSGIRRFVADFPVLGRWVESEGILLSIMRASRDRGWHHGVDEAEAEKTATAGQHPPPGLTYFGFLEVLSRTAYANKTGDGPDRSPLHLKLLALISAIKVDDTRGIWRL